MNEYSPVDLLQFPDFDPQVYKRQFSLLIPSQGTNKSQILHNEGEMGYEQRQYSMVIGDYPGLFVTRRQFPSAEKEYWDKLLLSKGEGVPETLVLPYEVDNISVPLAKIILDKNYNIGLIQKLVKKHRDRYQGKNELILHGFQQTSAMHEIADKLSLKYYGNAEFASWAGTKMGLGEFLVECGVMTPLTFPITDFVHMYGQIEQMADAGYEEIIVKVNNSTGGMGHKRISIGKALKYCEQGYYERILPAEYMQSEGAIIQGWIDEATSLSLAVFVDFDGTYTFTGAQMHELKRDNAFSAVGAQPMSNDILPELLECGHKIGRGYVKHKAYGPHTMGFILPSNDWCKKMGVPEGTLFANDENSRPGASTISLNWILTIRDGLYGKGWNVSKVEVPQGIRMSDVIAKLRKHGVLIDECSKDANGVFVFNGLVLDSGYENKFYAVTISANDSFEESLDMMTFVKNLFKES